MADETIVQNPDGADDTPSGEGGQNPEGEGTSLDSASQADLVKMVKELREENKSYRLKAKETQEGAETLQSELATMKARLEEIEDERKTEEEREAERIAALEEKATKAESLLPYFDAVKAEYEQEVKEIEGMKAKPKRAFMDALGVLPESDVLGRLRIIRAIRASSQTSDEVPPGDTGSPAEAGGGSGDKGWKSMLRFSPDAMEEARVAGLISSDD